MVNNTVVVPVAVLAALATCMLMFICWWFPRTWAKGQALDRREFDENAARRRRDLELAESGSTTDVQTDIQGGEAGTEAGTETGDEAQARKQAIA